MLVGVARWLKLYLQADGDPAIRLGALERDHWLFGLLGGPIRGGAPPFAHQLRGLPPRLTGAIAGDLLFEVDDPHTARLDRGRVVGLTGDGEILDSTPLSAVSRFPDGGWWQVDPAPFGFSWMGPTELTRLLTIHNGSTDYGPSHVEVVGLGRTSEGAPGSPLPFFEPWEGVPGPVISAPEELAVLFSRSILPARLMDAAYSLLHESGALVLERIGDPHAGVRRSPAPLLQEALERMVVLDQAGQNPQMVYWFSD